MTFSDKMKGLAKKANKRLVLAEGLEPRIVKAARKIVDEGLASSVTLVGDEEKVRANAKELGVDLTGILISDPAKCGKKDEFANEYYEMRKAKGMTP